MKNTALRKTTALVLVLCVLVSFALPVSAAGTDTAKTYYQSQTVLSSWWDAVAAADLGVDFTGKTLPSMPASKFVGAAAKPSATELASAILYAQAIGKNPRTAYGKLDRYDPVKKLAAMQAADGSFGLPNETIYAIIALESVDPSDYNGLKAAESLAGAALPGGGYTYFGDVADADLTGMALTAFSYYKTSEKVQAAMEKCIGILDKTRSRLGGYIPSWDTAENSASLAVVLSGLTACGYDVTDSASEFNNTYLFFKTFQLENGAFTYKLDKKAADGFSTPQCIIALSDIQHQSTVYQRNAERAYDLSAVYADAASVGSKYEPAIAYVYRKALMIGDDFRKFNPGEDVTRAEMATVIYRYLNTPAVAVNPGFSDVSSLKWYYNAIAAAKQAGIMVGGAKSFRPNDSVTLAEVAIILSKLEGLYTMPYAGSNKLEDQDAIPESARNAVLRYADLLGEKNAEGVYTVQNRAATREEIAYCFCSILNK